MTKVTRILLLAAFSVGLLGCEARTDKSGSGGVLLTITSFDGLPVGVSVSLALAPPPPAGPEGGGGGFVQVEELEIQSVVTDPTGTSSALMDVEIQSYEVSFSRADSGTRLPPTLTRGQFGSVPAGGTMELEGLPILTRDQLTHQPLRDLAERGADSETGSEIITLNLSLTFFGRTLSGDAVQTAPANFTVDFGH